MITPVVKRASYILAHVPSMVRHGSRPSRDIEGDPSRLQRILEHLQGFDQAVAYPPHQAFIGNLQPEQLWDIERPWYRRPVANARRSGPLGRIIAEEEFIGMMKVCDEFDLVLLDEAIVPAIQSRLRGHPLVRDGDLARLSAAGSDPARIAEAIAGQGAVPLYLDGSRLVGCCQRAHERDTALSAPVLLENLSVRASGVLALRHLFSEGIDPGAVDYLIGCGEEAVGDRYQRGGGNMAKAIGELCGCLRATGSDTKAFCCAPVHALVIAGGLVAAGVFGEVVVVAGGSLAKLGMKSEGHLRAGMPILEDVLAAIAIWVGPDDGSSPRLRLDCVGRHTVGSGSSQQAIFEKLVIEPLDKLGLRLTDIDRYATEMHNPELTEPQGSGDVPRTNYRIIASYAALRSEIDKGQVEQFIRARGMPGFSPTQGHIPSAVPYLGHALERIKAGTIQRAMFLAKGSLFLGRMTQMSDGMSFLLESNPGG